jgi:hypothetical protein
MATGGASTHPCSQRVRRRSQRAQLGALIVSVSLPMQHEDRGHQAAASQDPDPGTGGVFRFGRSLAPLWLFVGSVVRPMRPLTTLRLLWHRAHPTLARPPAPRCLLAAALRPVPTLWRPTGAQTVPPSEHMRRVHEPPGSLIAMRSLES